jgi:hypothetical protein
MDKTMDNLPPAPGLDGVRAADEPSAKYIKAPLTRRLAG